MAMNLEADSEVVLEGTHEDWTIRFDFRTSTLATLPPGREAKGRTNTSEAKKGSS